MSYLHMYESSKGIAPDEHDARKVEEESKNGPIQAKYVGQNLSTSIAEEILSTLEAVHAINLSHNNIDVFPKTISLNLLALDLSFNHINTPIVLNSAFNIVELNLSNNSIIDLRGLSMLISIEYLNLSENFISTVDGLENMKNLSSLKLSYNRISNFQGLRLLSYNSILTEVWMEGNPIESDVYYKVKLLNCIPNIKTLDGKTIWRRTAIQNQLINDNIQYSELYQRKPDDVEKYALLSKRSSSQLLSESVLNTFSGSMLTMQSLNNNNTTNANNTTAQYTTNNNSNTNSTSKQNHNTTAGSSNSNSQYYNQDSLPSPPKPEQLRRLPSNLRHLSEVTTVTAQNNSYSYIPSQTPYNTINCNTTANSTSSNKESKNDISMLPVHLQKQLKHLQQSPSPPRRSSTRSHSSKPSSTTVTTSKHTTGTTSTGTTSNSTRGATEQRAYSPLPWRRPPSITPNLETKFKSNRSNSVKKLRSDGNKSDTIQHELQHQTFSTEQKKKKDCNNNHHQSQVSMTLKNDDNLRNKQANPSTTSMNITTPSQSFRRNNYSFSSSQKQQQPQSQQTQVPTTPRNYSSTISINNTIEKTQKVLSTTPSFWMHPGLNPPPTNPTTPNGCLLGPPPNRFDSTQMERTISSSVIALQQSFDADQRQNIRDVNESFRGRSMLRTPSTKRLIHTKSMERQDSNRKLYTSSNNSIASRSVSPTRRSISQTRSSTGRQSFNAEILRNRQETEEKARDLAEAHTFERPTPVSPHHNAVYTIHQSVHSPTTGSKIGIGAGVVETPSSMGGSVFTFTSSKLAFSPAKVASRHGSQASVLPGHTASPPRISSTERILQHYSKQDHQRSHHNNNTAVVMLDEPVGVQNHLKLSSIPVNNSISTPNEETKDTVPITSSTETPSNVVVEDSSNNMDESPYKRFIRLRERLSAKYLETEHTATTQTQPSTSTPSTTEVVAAKQPLSASHVYDYARKMNVDAVEGMLNPVLNSPNAADFGEVESKIVELQEQDLQFQKLKEQYQQQYQAQYDSMRKDYDAKLGSNPHTGTTCSITNTATTIHPQTPSMTAHTVSTATPVAQAMAPVLTRNHLTPPLTGTTDVLKDLIERRRSVLGRITQPNELSPDKQHRSNSTGSIEHLPTGQGIHDAISELKNRQSASVNMLQSVTRDRPVQQHVHDNLSQVSINTPALHPSITNYSQLTNLSPIYANQSVMLPAGTSSLPSGNNFLSRLTANNPYMQSIGTTPSTTAIGTTTSATADGVGIMGMSGYPQMDVSRSFEPNTPYIPQFLPTPYQPPQQAVHMYSGYPPRPPKPFYG